MILGLHWLDLAALGAYFLAVLAVGWRAGKGIRNEEDYFLGGRRFGKLVSVFLAFGSGTSSDTAVSAARETYRSGFSGIWVQLLWLFVTPFYWILAPWYRRLRVVTGADFFRGRFQSPLLEKLYVLFGLVFFAFFIALGLTALGKTVEAVSEIPSRAAIPVIALVVTVYGIMGGLRAAAWTDTIQGFLILVLSVLLLPAGLAGTGWFSGLHERLPEETFRILGTGKAAQYPWHLVAALILMNLVGVVAQPHIFSVGGGGAKDEFTARVGLVGGNFLKRLTTILWGFTGLVAFALFGKAVSDPDKIWGYATQQLLGPGFVGLMIACLLAAAMSSADAYMVGGSALFTRNLYGRLRPGRPQSEYVLVGRIVSALVAAAGTLLALFFHDVLRLLRFVWQIPVIFGALFWLSILWRGVTKAAALAAVAYSFLTILVLPSFLAPPSSPPGLPGQPLLLLLWSWGVDPAGRSPSAWWTLAYLLDTLVPFLLLFGVSLFTAPPEENALNRFYARFHTPVGPDPEEDRAAVEAALAGLGEVKTGGRSSRWEIRRPSRTTLAGFLLCFLLALGIFFFALLLGRWRVP